MTFPTWHTADKTDGSVTGGSTDIPVTLPGNVAAGNLLLIAVIINDSLASPNLRLTTPTGWTSKGSGMSDGSDTELGCYIKVADGSESGATVNIPRTAGAAVWVAERFSGWYGTTAGVENGTLAPFTGSVPNPPSLTPSWGALDTKFIAIAGRHIDAAITAAPTNYGNLHTKRVAGTSGPIGLADRDLNATSDDPGTFTGLTGGGVAQTLAIRPSAADVLAPDVPSPSASTAHITTLDWTWSAVSDNGGGSVAGYIVQLTDASNVNIGSEVDVGNVTSYQATSLTQGTTYKLKVKAYDNAATPNVSAFSSLVSNTTLIRVAKFIMRNTTNALISGRTDVIVNVFEGTLGSSLGANIANSTVEVSDGAGEVIVPVSTSSALGTAIVVVLKLPATTGPTIPIRYGVLETTIDEA